MNRLLRCSSFCLLVLAINGAPLSQQMLGQEGIAGRLAGQAIEERVAAHLSAGEFVSAQSASGQLEGEARDRALAQIATAQRAAGDFAHAATTLQQVESSSYRGAALYPVASTPTNGAAADAPVPATPGGGAVADFDSLMQLIQMTVVPDTWEALGGPSTMAPYPQGIWVDPQGMIRDADVTDDSGPGLELDRFTLERAAPNSRALPGPEDWRQGATMRVVSLRRLRDEITRLQLRQSSLPIDATFTAGLSRITHVVYTDVDVLLGGPVGSIVSHQGWWVDGATGMHPIRLDHLVAGLRSALSNRPFGCTIDPQPQGLENAASVAQQIQTDQLPIGKAPEALVSALGPQRVEVFGTNPQSSLALMMIEADRHMKRLALGDVPMPDGLKNYFDFVDAMIASGPPSEVLIRLWFTSQPQQIRADSSRQVFFLSGTPMRLSGQNERDIAQGRVRVQDDPRTVAFVDEFNRNFAAIRSQYPLYGALESMYRSAAMAALLDRFTNDVERRSLVESLAGLEVLSSDGLPVPAQVDSIAKLHSVRHGKQRHHILLASGGVLVDQGAAIGTNVETYPTLASTAPQSASAPRLHQRWWWDLRSSDISND